ncbi:MAG: HipA family kinase [Candidatus Acidiferrales bacterium]
MAVEQVRRMRGGAQAHLMRCADDSYYVVKFRNNPQGVRILANELLGTRLAGRLGLPVASAAVVEVRAELIANTEDLVIQLGRGHEPCSTGMQFGSRYPDAPATTVVYDFLPDEQLRDVQNLDSFAGVLVFDKWTCNTNGRQAIFFRPPHESKYRAVMIDHGFCFNAGEWNFPDAPLRGIYTRQLVYERVRGMEAFEPWLERLKALDPGALDEAASAVPPEWYNFEPDALYRMLEQLYRRRTLVPELIRAAWKSSRIPFPNWT